MCILASQSTLLIVQIKIEFVAGKLLQFQKSETVLQPVNSFLTGN